MMKKNGINNRTWGVTKKDRKTKRGWGNIKQHRPSLAATKVMVRRSLWRDEGLASRSLRVRAIHSLR